MSTVLHDAPRHEGRTEWLRLPDVWASLAITAIWIAVAITAVFGSDILSTGAGGDSSRVPAAVAVALFAAIASWAVARYGFRRDRN
jgi:hypothetical protein